jgi:hypothetical protein
MDKQKLLEDFKQKFIGSTSKQPRKEYTGTNMMGISTMHKSNAVPVFSKESIKDISGMRR